MLQLQAYTTHPTGPVNPQCASCTQPPEDALLIAFTEHFKVILHPNQCSLGNVIIASRRHVARICDFNAAEMAEFTPLFALVEPALEAAFEAELLNLYYQRNWAYRTQNPDPPFKDGHPNPHAHCHLVPRYSRPVEFDGHRWVDTTFGEPFVWGSVSLPAPLRLAIIARIRSQLPITYIPLEKSGT